MQTCTLHQEIHEISMKDAESFTCGPLCACIIIRFSHDMINVFLTKQQVGLWARVSVQSTMLGLHPLVIHLHGAITASNSSDTFPPL